ncbi:MULTISPECIES: YaiI/YqxD family protein [unclassified Jeotgalibaca]|uniref:YaiI/YqxD family protein n=1 Tax=unclassified Jeotgalibaca TaxID=2621505 RepID=UPI003FD51C8E
MKIVIDSDASPVKDIVIEEAGKRDLIVVLVASYAHFSNKVNPSHVETVYVDSAKEAADYRIMQLLNKDDILITQDYGLASLALGKKAIVLHHKGFQFDKNNIVGLLESRYLSAQIRKSGKRTKGPKPFTQEDAQKFRSLLIHTLAQ